MNSKYLTDTERELFVLFSKAIHTNPFTSERREIDCKISKLPAASSDKTILNKVTRLAAKQVNKLQQPNRAKDTALSSKADRELIRNVYLFHQFHSCSGLLDKHILAQSKEKNKLLPLPEADSILLTLNQLGFSRVESLHYFALFFQMRRAYFFIQRNLVGVSPAMKRLRAQLWNNIFTHDIDRYATVLWERMEDFSTLLLGDTGTGKSLAAAAIGRSCFIPFHQKEKCFQENFATIFISRNLSQYSEQLIESELFGHKKGSFTGAIQSHQGIFTLCSPHGAIFLDEIGDATIPIQIKLLQVLQERIFSPVGSQEERRFSGRVIAATNRPLNEMRKQGIFRNDFYFRLCSDKITIPSLQKRIMEDPRELELLVDFLLTRITGQANDELSDEILQIILRENRTDYPWHGNVRELEQCIRQILLNNRCFDKDTNKQNIPATNQNIINTETLNLTELTSEYCHLLYKRHLTYQAVARITGLDRRTVKRYLDMKDLNKQLE